MPTSRTPSPPESWCTRGDLKSTRQQAHHPIPNHARSTHDGRSPIALPESADGREERPVDALHPPGWIPGLRRTGHRAPARAPTSGMTWARSTSPACSSPTSTTAATRSAKPMPARSANSRSSPSGPSPTAGHVRDDAPAFRSNSDDPPRQKRIAACRERKCPSR